MFFETALLETHAPEPSIVITSQKQSLLQLLRNSFHFSLSSRQTVAWVSVALYPRQSQSVQVVDTIPSIQTTKHCLGPFFQSMESVSASLLHPINNMFAARSEFLLTGEPAKAQGVQTSKAAVLQRSTVA